MGMLRGVGLVAVLLSSLGCLSREEQSDAAFDRGNAASDRKDY